jgi:hypothetical protein
MKSIVEVLSLFLILVISLYSSAEAQNTTNGNNSNYTGGGLSTNSVDIAKSNVNDLTPNTNGNNSNYTGGGLSTNSVDIAKSNVNDLIQ